MVTVVPIHWTETLKSCSNSRLSASLRNSSIIIRILSITCESVRTFNPLLTTAIQSNQSITSAIIQLKASVDK